MQRIGHFKRTFRRLRQSFLAFIKKTLTSYYFFTYLYLLGSVTHPEQDLQEIHLKHRILGRKMSNENVEKMCAFKPAKILEPRINKICHQETVHMYLVLHHVRYMLKSSM